MEVLNDPGWDFQIGPGFNQEWRGDEVITTYHRLWCDDAIGPLVIVRHFPHGRPSSFEISQELGLLFELYEDRHTGLFNEMQDDGSEQEVIRVTSDRVEIRTSLIRRYLAARQPPSAARSWPSGQTRNCQSMSSSGPIMRPTKLGRRSLAGLFSKSCMWTLVKFGRPCACRSPTRPTSSTAKYWTLRTFQYADDR